MHGLSIFSVADVDVTFVFKNTFSWLLNCLILH